MICAHTKACAAGILSLPAGEDVNDSYNSKPPLGTKSNDLGLFTGINVKFGAM